MDGEHDPFADRWWHAVACDAKIETHVRSINFRYIEIWPLHADNWNEMNFNLRYNCNAIQWIRSKKKKFIKAIFFELENKWCNYLSLESILVYLNRFLHLKIARWIRIRFLRSVFIFHRKFRWSYTFRQFRIREWSFWNGPEQLFHRSVYLPPPVYPQYDENCVEISSPPPPLIICFGK